MVALTKFVVKKELLNDQGLEIPSKIIIKRQRNFILIKLGA